METTTSNSSAAVGGPSYLCRGVFDALSFFIIAQHLSKLTAITRENLRVLAPIKRFAPRLHDDYRPRVLTPARACVRRQSFAKAIFAERQLNVRFAVE